MHTRVTLILSYQAVTLSCRQKEAPTKLNLNVMNLRMFWCFSWRFSIHLQLHVHPWCAVVSMPHSQKVPGSNPSLVRVLLCGVCMFSSWVSSFSPNMRWCETLSCGGESEWLFLSVWWLCNTLASCPGCLPSACCLNPQRITSIDNGSTDTWCHCTAVGFPVRHNTQKPQTWDLLRLNPL